MSYQKQNFANGEVLSAAQLNHIEDGIVDVESSANETKSVVDKIIDPTLSLSGKAADAKITGDEIGQLKSDLIDQNLISINKLNPKDFVANKVPNNHVGVSKPTDLVDFEDTSICTTLIAVKTGDKLYINDNTGYYKFSCYFYNEDKLYVKELLQAKEILVDMNGYVLVKIWNCTTLDTFISREYYLNINRNYGYTPYGMNETQYIAKINQTDLSEIKDFVHLDYEIQNGYYDGNIFYENELYQSIKIPCKYGERYKITEYLFGEARLSKAYFYDKNFNLVGKTDTITTDTWVIGEEIEIPYNVYYLVVMHRVNNSDIKFEVKKYGFEKYTQRLNELSKKPLEGKTCLIFGDSITYQSERWRDKFLEITGLKQLACVSFAGAHLTDYQNTVLDGVYWGENELIHQNTVCNQVQYVLNNHNDIVNPDIIIISAFTNDSFSPEQLTIETDINVYHDDNGWIDSDTVDRTTPDGAMRWQTTKLHELYPDARIFYASPIQAHPMIHKIEETIAKEDKMDRICKKLSVQLIKAGSESGITGEFEHNLENGKYLSDGLHPNVNGGNVLGKYYANEVIAMYRY